MKKVATSLLAVMLISSTTSSLALADEKESKPKTSEKSSETYQFKVESQKKDLDSIKKTEDTEMAINYKINEKGLSDKQKEELVNYKSKIINQMEKQKKEKRKFFTTFGVIFLLMTLFVISVSYLSTSLNI